MKIIGIGANYYMAKNERLKNPEDLMIFTKPETSLATGNTFQYPECSKKVFYELEIVLRLNKELKNAHETEASESFDEVALGVDWTAKDLQLKAKDKGWPWVFAKGFDQAAFLSKWMPVSDFNDLNNLNLTFKVNGEVRQYGNTNQMIADYGKIIAYTSKFMTLHPGDIIMTGTPPVPGEIFRGDHCEGFIDDQKYLDFEVV